MTMIKALDIEVSGQGRMLRRGQVNHRAHEAAVDGEYILGLST